MRSLNYHHLYYFYRVARAGSIAAAARELHVTHSTLSVQIRDLGAILGGPLFEKRGRRLVLTARGDEALAYSEDIFRMGAELVEAARARDGTRSRLPMRVGIVPGLPRSLAYRLMEPALAALDGPLVLRTDSYARLLDELASGKLHVLLADEPPESSAGRGKTFTHPLGRSGISFYAAPALARALRGGFPRSLASQPLVLPSPGSGLRRLVDRWLTAQGVRARVVADVDDAAMMRAFGARGHGVFPVRMALRAEVEDALGAELVGVLDGVEETYCAISIERRVRHPFVSALVDHAREALDPR